MAWERVKISVYADGSSTGRSDGPGGWCYIVAHGQRPLSCQHGGNHSTTNNRMELTGAIRGLQQVKQRLIDQPSWRLLNLQIELVSDSQYVLGLASGAYSPKANQDLAKQLRALALELNITTRWVRGHQGDPFNERCDRLAKLGKKEAGA